MVIGICDSNIQKVNEIVNLIKEDLYMEGIEIKKYVPREVIFDIEDRQFQCDIFITELIFEDYEHDGIYLAKQINKNRPICKIMFYAECVPKYLDVYEVKHSNCLLKSGDSQKLITAIKKIINEINERKESKYISVRYSRSIYVLKCEAIIMIRKENRITKFYTDSNIYVEYKPLKDIEQVLPEYFVRCNSSCIVNKRYIRFFNHSELVLSNGETLKIGRAFKQRVLAK